jgi:hypothetical protein
MIISGIEMLDDMDDKAVRQHVFATGIRELEIWKRALNANTALFNRLFEYVFSEDQRLAWRSCWIIDCVSEDFPELLYPKLPKIIEGFLTTKDGSLKRHFTRILCRYQIPSEYLGVIVNRSFELLGPYEPTSVRVHAMQLLFNIAQHENDLKGELISVIEQLIDVGGSTGFHNRSSKLLRQLRS